jgi:hypothetical protein
MKFIHRLHKPPLITLFVLAKMHQHWASWKLNWFIITAWVFLCTTSNGSYLSLLACAVLCATLQIFKFKVLKFCHSVFTFKTCFNFIKILACYITLCLTLHVLACRPSSGVVAVGKLLHFLCTFLLYLKFSVQSSAAHCVFLVSRVLALLPLYRV